MTGVMCPKCGKISASTAASCTQCGTSLRDAGGATGKRQSLRMSKAESDAVRTQMDSDDGAASSTLQDDEPKKPAPPPRKAAPTAQPGPRASGGGVVPKKSLAQGKAAMTGSKDSLLGKTLNDYVVEEKIGTGGMGVVYRAVQPMIGKHVAIKVLKPEVVTDPRDMDRFLEEARIVNSIKHRGIINIFGAGTLEDGRHYLIMELLEGESLEQLMVREGKVAAGDAVIILEEVLSGLAAAHEAGVVHRDLKPANIFLVKEAGSVYVKLLDFGLARRNTQNVTRIAGTPDYISPEHARGRPAGPPADLYAFGILCFHMLTGQLPFTGNTPMEVMEKHVHVAPPVPHEVNPAIPKALSELILKLLGKDPGERPDARQVKADLRAATKQLRNAKTMMSLVSVAPVTATKEEVVHEQARAKELAREAQVADLKRTVSKKWPIIAGAVALLWLVAVAIYVLSPSKPPPPLPVKPVKKGGGEKPPPTRVDPGEKPPPVAVEPARVAAVDAGAPSVAVPVAVVEEVDAGAHAAVAQTPTVAGDEPDAGEELKENPDAELDDFRLGELKRSKRFDERLDSMELIMKSNQKKQLRYGNEFKAVKDRCLAAKTLRQVSAADDDLGDIERDFFK